MTMKTATALLAIALAAPASAQQQPSQRHVTMGELIGVILKIQTKQEIEKFETEFKRYTGKDLNAVLKDLLLLAHASQIDIVAAEGMKVKPTSHDVRHCRDSGQNDKRCFEQFTWENIAPQTEYTKQNMLRWKVITTDVNRLVEAVNFCGSYNGAVTTCIIEIDENPDNTAYFFSIKDKDKGNVASLYFPPVLDAAKGQR